MQEVKDLLKNIGKHFQTAKSSHKEMLRQKLAATQSNVREVSLRPFSWMPFLSTGVLGVIALLVVVKFTYRPYAVPEPEYEDDVIFANSESALSSGLAAADYFSVTDGFDASDTAGDISIRTPQPQNIQSHTGDVIDYEEKNGDMFEEQVTVSLLTNRDDASTVVSELFASLGGHLSSINDNEEYASVSGSVPMSRLSFFYDQLDDLVKNDAFLEKHVTGDSITSQALDLAKRRDALTAAQADVTAQLQAATTDEEKKKLQESLDTMSEEIDELTDEQDALDDRVEYVEISVSIMRLPSLWEVQGEYDLRQVIAGYDTPNLWQRMVINILTVVLICLEVLSATFWILIPLAFIAWKITKRRRLLRELE